VVWSWLWGISWLSWVVFWVLSNTFVFDIGNISTVSITNIIGYDLSTAIGKIDTVFAVGGVSVTVFVGLKVSFCVVVMYSISVFIDGWSIIRWFLAVSWSSVISWSWVYNWLVDNWGNIWSWSWVYNWFVDNWGYIWSWSVNWGWVVNWGWLVNGSCVINWSRLVISWGWVVWGWSVNWNMRRSMNGSTVLFSSIWVVYVLWCSMGLFRHSCVVCSMGLMDSNFDGRGVAVLDNLVTALVSQSNSQKSR